MNSRERVIATLNHRPVDRAPRDLWTLPWVNMFCQDRLDEMLRLFPLDIANSPTIYGKSARASGTPGNVGFYTDEWGCRWYSAEPGVAGEVKEHIIENWSDLAHYKPPFELLDNADTGKVNDFCSQIKDKFIKGGIGVRPFERMQFLRGTEKLLIDFAYGTKEVRDLIDMVHDFYCRGLRILAQTDVDAVGFLDDWGSQTSLLISLEMWRELFKPLYKDYCDILHEKGKYAFFHSDGFIMPLFPDLIEIGVDAVNSQLFCMDIEQLGKQFSGRITFWGEIDRQNILPFGSQEDVRNAVRRVKKAFSGSPRGLIAQCEWGKGISFDNIAAVFDEWDKPSQGNTLQAIDGLQRISI
ncbi:MAG: uroporphyrinogen decarboxylase family protein [Phycisphaerae bacterium]|nr:uroporphyrinogen decarboxylase family protein [Phycisphaerae bacterium]MDD5458045.1 uroporphyrinogen decarboxylase family protein [Phycisphaerae bacterium]